MALRGFSPRCSEEPQFPSWERSTPKTAAIRNQEDLSPWHAPYRQHEQADRDVGIRVVVGVDGAQYDGSGVPKGNDGLAPIGSGTLTDSSVAV